MRQAADGSLGLVTIISVNDMGPDVRWTASQGLIGEADARSVAAPFLLSEKKRWLSL